MSNNRNNKTKKIYIKKKVGGVNKNSPKQVAIHFVDNLMRKYNTTKSSKSPKSPKSPKSSKSPKTNRKNKTSSTPKSR